MYAFFLAVGLWLAMLTAIVMYLAYSWYTYEKTHEVRLEHRAHGATGASVKNDSLTPEQVRLGFLCMFVCRAASCLVLMFLLVHFEMLLRVRMAPFQPRRALRV